MNLPKNIKGGQDIKHIIYKENIVEKFFRNNSSYQNTIDFYYYFDNHSFLPKILMKEKKNLKIEMENAGDLLSLYTLPKKWETQILYIQSTFCQKNRCILDLRFLPNNPFIINNICLKNDKLYLVDVALHRHRSNKYIQYKMQSLIYNIKIRHYFKNNFILLWAVHILLEIIRLFMDVIEKIIYPDIRYVF
jgi:hypothetical protein